MNRAANAPVGSIQTARGGHEPGSAVEAIAYLEQRDPRALKDAEEYVRRAPAQVRTAYREEFERHFGWTPI